MLELALQGDKKYQGWIGLLIICIGVGMACFMWQLDFGLGITGLSRDVSWGFYVAQLTFLVGVAASAVMLVLPYYLHKYLVKNQYFEKYKTFRCLVFRLLNHASDYKDELKSLKNFK